MAKIMDPILPILSILGYWAIILGSFGGPGMNDFPQEGRGLYMMGLHLLDDGCESSGLLVAYFCKCGCGVLRVPVSGLQNVQVC